MDNWYNAVGNTDYVDWAFRAAAAADPNAQLFLNDFETENSIKQEYLVDVVRRLVNRGVPIDGIGHQFHINLLSDVDDLLGAIDRIETEFPALINHVTELDVSFYNDPGSCWESGTNCDPERTEAELPALFSTQATLLRDLLNGLENRNSVESVTFWGIMDQDSWLNEAPIVRNNYPLLFDRDGEPKPAAFAIADDNYQIP